MPRRLSAALVVALAAATVAPRAWAQERDHIEQMVHAVQERKARSLHQVQTAPAKVQDYIRHTDVDIGFKDRPDVEHKVNPLEDDGFSLTGTDVFFIALSLALIVGFFLTRKFASR